MKTAKLYLIALISLSGKLALAASGGEAHDAIPWDALVIPQIVNLAILVSGLTFALKGPVRGYFAGKATKFESARQDAEAAKKKAEATHQEVKSRLAQLENSSTSSLETAKQEAQALKLKLVAEAKQAAQRLDEEAKRTASHELQKAAFSLRTELLNKSLELADKEITSGLDQKTQTDLQSAFVDRAQAVH